MLSPGNIHNKRVSGRNKAVMPTRVGNCATGRKTLSAARGPARVRRARAAGAGVRAPTPGQAAPPAITHGYTPVPIGTGNGAASGQDAGCPLVALATA